MTNTIVIKCHDNSRILQDTLTYSDGSIIDLTDATVTLVWQGIEKEADIVDETAGTVAYSLTTEDVAQPAKIYLEWRVKFADNTYLTVPTSNRIVLRILQDLLNT